MFRTVNLALSRRGDYVVRSAICLARAYGSGEPRKLRQVSAEMGVPRTFVSQILGDLSRAGLAVSSFGKDGGYRLARAPGQVSLLEVIEAGEGPLAPEACAPGSGPCQWRAICPVYGSWAAASGALREVLAATSLAGAAGPGGGAGASGGEGAGGGEGPGGDSNEPPGLPADLPGRSAHECPAPILGW